MTTALLLGRKAEAAAALDILLDRGIRVEAVVEDEDRAHPGETALTKRARSRGVPTRSLEELARDRKPVDHVISYLFKRMIPPDVLALARGMAINFHPAPLPDWRGLRGYNVAILEGVSAWAATAHLMTGELDRGDVIAERPVAVEREDTAWSLERRTQREMLVLFAEVADALAEGRDLPRRRQGPGKSLSRAEFERLRRVEPDDPPDVVERKVRAFWYPPYPGAYVEIAGRRYTLASDELLAKVTPLAEEE